ncbi:MAG: hypothetical protein ABSE87_07805 [Terracidiphilus sp.]|jgi:hypothetical protein
MSPRQRLANDSYLAGLKRRSELALEWFDGVARVLQKDVEEFSSQAEPTANAAFIMETLDIQITGDLPIPETDTPRKPPYELTISTKCAKARVVANNPTGWLFIEISKRSPMFDGVLHRGAIEIALVPYGVGNHELHFVECDWLSADGSEFPKSAQGIADKLWELLFLPQVRHQFGAAQKSHGR